jgi:hypothetical protein
MDLFDLFFVNIAYAAEIDTFIRNVNRLILNPLITLLFALAFGSLCELETQILIAQEEYQIDCKEIKQSITELQKMLRSLINKTKH